MKEVPLDDPITLAITDFRAWADSQAYLTGRRPNVLRMTEETWLALRSHPDVLVRVHPEAFGL